MAAVAAAAITAAVAAGTTAYSASQSQKAASTAARAAGKTKQVPLPGYATALNKDVARLIALNMTKVPPSFAQYVSSGGTAKFPIDDPGLDPRQREQLGLIGPHNSAVPFAPRDQAGNPLSLSQVLFLGAQRLSHNPNRQDPISRLTRSTNLLNRLQKEAQTPKVQRRESRVSGRISNLQGRLGVSGES